jgi:glycolate oxidase iron-sulfur subunit
VNTAAVHVLTRNGIEVVVPQEELCCGALHLQLGDKESAQRSARKVIDAFPRDLDAVVVTAAGCGAAMKEYGRLLGGDSRYAGRAAAFADHVRDVTEFLGERQLQVPERRVEARVACHDPCHLAHAQGVRDAPRELLRLIPGVELVELAESDVCCGSAGSYNLTETAMARRLRDRKTDNVAVSGATVVAAANPGCILQIAAGLRERGLNIRVVHPVELLAEAYGEGSG